MFVDDLVYDNTGGRLLINVKVWREIMQTLSEIAMFNQKDQTLDLHFLLFTCKRTCVLGFKGHETNFQTCSNVTKRKNSYSCLASLRKV